MQHIKPLPQHTSMLDANSAIETARLIHQHELITRFMGGLLPEGINGSNIKQVLDLACGPGGWVLDLAHAHPETLVTGIDISKTMVCYARASARVQGLENARFTIMDILEPLDFPDGTFDLVHARLLVTILPKEAWSQVIQQCMRVLRPGGILCLAESDMPLTNSPACEKLTELCLRAMHLADYHAAPDKKYLSITSLLGDFLYSVGCQQVQHHAHFLNYSPGTEGYWSMFRNMEVLHELLKPFLLTMEVAAEDELLQFQHEAIIQMLSDDFCGDWCLVTVWGLKPEHCCSLESLSNTLV